MYPSLCYLAQFCHLNDPNDNYNWWYLLGNCSKLDIEQCHIKWLITLTSVNIKQLSHYQRRKFKGNKFDVKALRSNLFPYMSYNKMQNQSYKGSLSQSLKFWGIDPRSKLSKLSNTSPEPIDLEKHNLLSKSNKNCLWQITKTS